jgi:DNA-binding MarR family transcriptional regulator
MEDTQKQLLTQILKKLEGMEERLGKLEQGSSADSQIKLDLPPSLARILKNLAEVNKPASSDELSREAGLSRNLTSGYLSRLVDMGYVTREPNLDKRKDARYLFKLNKDKIPKNVRRIIE